MTRREPRSLAWRLYGFAALIVFVSLGTMIATALIVGARPEDAHARAIEAVVGQLDARFPDDAGLGAALRDDPTLRRLELVVYDRAGHRVAGGDRSTPAPTAAELAIEPGASVVEIDRIVVAMGAHRVVVHHPAGAPTGRRIVVTLLGVLGIILVIALGVTIGFARTIVRPLRALGDAARAFGRGETSVRTQLTRRDELGAVGHAFDEMANRIEQLLQTQRAMMADISHELRTPLTRIKLALELAIADPQAAQQVLDDVGADLEEVEQIIEDVFVVVRLDTAGAGGVIHRKPVDLVELVRHAAARFEAHHPRHPLAIELGDVDRAPVAADGPLLRRAVDNLLDNAAKYSADGEPVTLRLRRDAGFAIEVADRGVGMTTSELALAFTPFWRADESRARATGGVGLGLALARRIARAHGGDVELVSQRAAGTTARLVLPGEPG